MNKCLIAILAQGMLLFASAQARGPQDLIVNGGFNFGLFDWTATPNVAVVSSYSTLGPVVDPSAHGGNYFAVMSPNGANPSALSQDPSVPADFHRPVVLSFEFDLVALDTAVLQKNEEQGATLSLSIAGDPVFSETYTAAGGPALNKQGESGQTDWQTVTMALTASEFDAVKANGVEFDFTVDQADSKNYDFAAAIDNVALIGRVPDSPSTAFLLGGVLPAIGFIKRINRSKRFSPA